MIRMTHHGNHDGAGFLRVIAEEVGDQAESGKHVGAIRLTEELEPHDEDCLDVVMAQRCLLHPCGDTLAYERCDCILGLLGNGAPCGAEGLHNPP